MKRVLQTFRRGRAIEDRLEVPLLEGEQGNMQTLEAMRAVCLEDRLDPTIRAFVLSEIVRGVPGHDAAGEVKQIFDFAQQRITYRQDPYNVERVADVWSTLHALAPDGPEGDCGIKSLFIATCCAILGHKPFFAVIKTRPDQTAFTHVYNGVMIDGEMRYYDATPEDAPAGWEAPSFEKKLFPIFD